MVLLAFILPVGVLLGFLGGLVNAAKAHPGVPKRKRVIAGLILYAVGVPLCFLVAYQIGRWVSGAFVQVVILFILAFPFWAVAHAVYGVMDKENQQVAE